MKPSEFITKFKVYKEQNNIILKPVTFEDLDLKFIDREELKDKILNILEDAKSNACIKAYNDKEYLKEYEKTIKKEILELLK